MVRASAKEMNPRHRRRARRQSALKMYCALVTAALFAIARVPGHVEAQSAEWLSSRAISARGDNGVLRFLSMHFADVDGDGDLDIVYHSQLPYPRPFRSIGWLEKKVVVCADGASDAACSGGFAEPRPIATEINYALKETKDSVTAHVEAFPSLFHVGDVDGDGLPDIVFSAQETMSGRLPNDTRSFSVEGMPAVFLMRNLGGGVYSDRLLVDLYPSHTGATCLPRITTHGSAPAIAVACEIGGFGTPAFVALYTPQSPSSPSSSAPYALGTVGGAALLTNAEAVVARQFKRLSNFDRTLIVKARDLIAPADRIDGLSFKMFVAGLSLSSLPQTQFIYLGAEVNLPPFSALSVRAFYETSPNGGAWSNVTLAGTDELSALSQLCGSGTASFLLADVNSDGLPDLVAHGTKDSAILGLYWMENTGSAPFGQPRRLLATPKPVIDALVVDLDGDSIRDLAYVTQDGAYVLYGGARGIAAAEASHSDAVLVAAGLIGTLQLSVEDIDADGKADLFVLSSATGVAVLNKRDSSFGEPLAAFVGASATGTDAGPPGAAPSDADFAGFVAEIDINGDGLTDVVYGAMSSTDVARTLSEPDGVLPRLFARVRSAENGTLGEAFLLTDDNELSA
eukprot:Opistho-2@93892